MDMITLAMAKAYSDKKGGYIEPAKIIFSEQLESGNLQTEKNIDIVAGEKYTIFLTDGKEKYILATSVVAKVTDGIAWLGNLSLIFGDEEENTGESYVVISTPTQGAMIITGTSSNATLAIEIPETIHPIDPKFLPKDRIVIDLEKYDINLNSLAELASVEFPPSLINDILTGLGPINEDFEGKLITLKSRFMAIDFTCFTPYKNEGADIFSWSTAVLDTSTMRPALAAFSIVDGDTAMFGLVPLAMDLGE